MRRPWRINQRTCAALCVAPRPKNFLRPDGGISPDNGAHPAARGILDVAEHGGGPDAAIPPLALTRGAEGRPARREPPSARQAQAPA